MQNYFGLIILTLRADQLTSFLLYFTELVSFHCLNRCPFNVWTSVLSLFLQVFRLLAHWYNPDHNVFLSIIATKNWESWAQTSRYYLQLCAQLSHSFFVAMIDEKTSRSGLIQNFEHLKHADQHWWTELFEPNKAEFSNFPGLHPRPPQKAHGAPFPETPS